MPIAPQARLVQVLSEGEFVPVGASEPVHVRFALVSASFRDLRVLVRDGRFREDLYYRLSGATLVLPALRERADRDELVERAFMRAAAEAEIPFPTLTEAARRALARHSWPGNLRELQHVARFAMAVRDSSIIDLKSPPPPLGSVDREVLTKAMSTVALRQSATDLGAVSDALRRAAWNVSGAAALPGVSRATLHRRLHQFNLKRPPKA